MTINKIREGDIQGVRRRLTTLEDLTLLQEQGIVVELFKQVRSAPSEKQAPLLKVLLDKGLSLKAQEAGTGATLLHILAGTHDVDSIKFITDFFSRNSRQYGRNKPDFNVKTKSGYIPLEYAIHAKPDAAKENKLKMIGYLVNHPSVNLADPENLNNSFKAVFTSLFDKDTVISFLKHKNIDPNVNSPHGDSVFYHAIKNKSKEVLDVLFKQKKFESD